MGGKLAGRRASTPSGMTMMTPDTTSPDTFLTLREAVAASLAEREAAGVPPEKLKGVTYRRAYTCVLDGKLKTVVINGRHYVSDHRPLSRLFGF
jgi:hypothetical protein